MKLLLTIPLAAVTAAGALKISQPGTAVGKVQDNYKREAISCSPDRLAMQKLIEETDIPPMPGAGNYRWKINTRADSAQFYFNQGINMYYGFHIIEALASFKKAAKFDDRNPMIFWGQALAYGPNINDVAYTVLPQTLEAVERANALLPKAQPFEKALIAAITARYSSDSALTREKLNNDYKQAMRTVYEKFPENADAAALYVDAMMLEHPWELWNINGTPKPWTPLIRNILEKTLIRAPQHPGINHYYIHVMEPSPFPEKAMASANRLGITNPGLAHLVHMPSHIYLRTGYYQKGYAVNEKAVQQYQSYLELYPAVAGSEFLYRLHNEHMLINCAMHAGRKKYAIGKAVAFQASIASFLSEQGAMGNYLGYIYMIPTLAMVRFEDWQGLLHSPAIDSSNIYANLLWHFGRGMAFANTNRITAAEFELSKIKTLLGDSVLSLPFTPFSPAIDGAIIAENMLEGTIALKKKDYPTAISDFTIAVEKENNMVYNEPRDWLLNPKYYLADAFYSSGRWKEAEKTFKADLKDNNDNIWSLKGLQNTLLRQNRTKEAAVIEATIKKISVAE